MTLKKWLKVPLLIFAILPAMVSSISELISKVMGCILMEATSWLDYLWLLLFCPILAFTAYKTLIYINYGIKYYDQMEVMPIYSTNILIHNIIVGMLCLNELKFYDNAMLFAITFSALLNLLGIYILLQKNREKGDLVTGDTATFSAIESTDVEMSSNIGE